MWMPFAAAGRKAKSTRAESEERSMKTFFVLAACAAGLCGADIVVDDGETVDLSVAGDAVQTELVWTYGTR